MMIIMLKKREVREIEKQYKSLTKVWYNKKKKRKIKSQVEGAYLKKKWKHFTFPFIFDKILNVHSLFFLGCWWNWLASEIEVLLLIFFFQPYIWQLCENIFLSFFLVLSHRYFLANIIGLYNKRSETTKIQFHYVIRSFYFLAIMACHESLNTI